jgi:hypothetical protein
MIVWAIGRLASVQVGNLTHKLVIDALQSSYWKVRAAACTAIASFGPQMAERGLPILLKLFKEGNNNRQILAETIISLGPKGEQQLIALIKQNQSETRLINNVKAKECIIKAFALANVSNPNIDFVIETLFYVYQQEQNAQVRKVALISLDILHKKSFALQSQDPNFCGGEQLPNNQSFVGEDVSSQRALSPSSRTTRKSHFNTYL